MITPVGGDKDKKAVFLVRFGEPNPVHSVTVDKYYQKSPGVERADATCLHWL